MREQKPAEKHRRADQDDDHFMYTANGSSKSSTAMALITFKVICQRRAFDIYDYYYYFAICVLFCLRFGSIVLLAFVCGERPFLCVYVQLLGISFLFLLLCSCHYECVAYAEINVAIMDNKYAFPLTGMYEPQPYRFRRSSGQGNPNQMKYDRITNI